MIGFVKKPTGRMGNILIQYIFLRQVADYLEIDYFHPELPYTQYFKGFEKRKRSVRERFKKQWRVDNKLIQQLGLECFLNEARQRSFEGYSVILDPPILGYLLAFKNTDPRKYIILKNITDRILVDDDKIIQIGIHFRGGDFKAWNENASLPFSYYKTAIDYCIEYYGKHEVFFNLYTDDVNFDAYLSTVAYLHNCEYNYTLGNPSNDMIIDFIRLSQSDVIISSPSTFAIMAGLLGKPGKKIIHSELWLQYCIRNNDYFWVSLLENNSPLYKLWKAL